MFTRAPTDVDDGVDVYASVDGDPEPWLAAGFVEHRRDLKVGESVELVRRIR